MDTRRNANIIDCRLLCLSSPVGLLRKKNETDDVRVGERISSYTSRRFKLACFNAFTITHLSVTAGAGEGRTNCSIVLPVFFESPFFGLGPGSTVAARHTRDSVCPVECTRADPTSLALPSKNGKRLNSRDRHLLLLRDAWQMRMKKKKLMNIRYWNNTPKTNKQPVR